MPATKQITERDVEAEVERLRENTERFPAFRILTEQVPDGGINPQRVGLAELPSRTQ